MPAGAVFQLEAVVVSHGSVRALRGVDLAVPVGRTTVLVGPSGGGKSTVLRLLVGLVRPEAGTVRFHGEPLESVGLPAVRGRLGYVIQEGGLFPHLTVAENVTLAARARGWEAARRRERADELARLLHLPADALDRFPRELSGGQRQRVALARALALDPEVLLLDEPLGALDPLVRRDLQEELAELFRALGKTVVLVTHDLAEATFFADRVALLREGRVAQQGSVADLLARPADDFVRRFVRAQRPLLPPEGA